MISSFFPLNITRYLLTALAFKLVLMILLSFFSQTCFGRVLSQYPAALMNLGAILHLNGKLAEAEANYLRALQLKPDDAITQSNLRKLRNIMKRQELQTRRPGDL